MLKNKIIIFALSIFIAVPITFATEKEFIGTVEPARQGIFETLDEGVQQENVQQEEITTEEQANEEISSPPEEEIIADTTYKQPISRKKIIKKFLAAMLCVGFSSFIIYIGLILYNRMREGFFTQTYTPSEGESSLDTPNSLSDAIKTFLEKTKW